MDGGLLLKACLATFGVWAPGGGRGGGSFGRAYMNNGGEGGGVVGRGAGQVWLLPMYTNTFSIKWALGGSVQYGDNIGGGLGH